MDISSFILGLKMGGGGGGGSSVTIESLSVTENGTTTAPTGKAYSPVVVNVPNSYTAGDEGKVVSNGALVAQSSDTVTQNGTVDTTLINSLLVNVSGGGGLEYEEGTWTPATDIADYTISLNNTHDKAPLFYMISDTTGTYDETAGNMYGVTFFNFGAIWPAVDASASAKQYGRVIYAYRSNSSTVTSSAQTLTAYSTSGTTYASTDARYWATETFIRARGDGSKQFKTNRTYKWIAVWAPEA